MFHRSYDISCILDNSLRTHVQNAINGVNKACTETVDAWLYVQQGYILNDFDRSLGPHDSISRTIFDTMRIDNPSISYIFTAINTLVSISQDYLTWQIQCQQENTKSEDTSHFWASWKANHLHPYYSASSGGGSRAGIIPLLEEFYSTRSSRADGVSEELEALENQLLSCLGSTLSERIMTLEQIPLDIYPSSNSLLKAYKKRITETVTEKDHNVAQIMEATYILRAAMESRNPVALRAALNPGWYSVGYHTSDLYREAEALLTQL